MISDEVNKIYQYAFLLQIVTYNDTSHNIIIILNIVILYKLM